MKPNRLRRRAAKSEVNESDFYQQRRAEHGFASVPVRSFERLRVIDASIMPTVVSGNTNAAAVMIGEKGAGMVLQDASGGESAAAISA
jgi:hypothetical protein